MRVYVYITATALAAALFHPALAKPAATPEREGSVDRMASAHAAVDPKARELLTRMTLAYKSLRSYTAKVEIIAGAGPEMNRSNSTVSYRKPNLAFIYTKSPSGTFRTIADGKSIYVSKPGDKKEYEQMPSGADSGAIALAIRTGGASAIGLFPFVAAGSDPYALLSRNLKSLTLLSSDTVAGVSVDVVQAVESAPGLKDATMTIAIGHDDRLIRRVGFLSGDGRAIVETISEVQIDPELPGKLFHFTPPAGAKSIPITPSQP